MDLGGWLYATAFTNRTRSFLWLVGEIARPTFRTGQAQKPYPLYWRFRHLLPPGRCVQALRQRWWLPPLPLLHRTSVL